MSTAKISLRTGTRLVPSSVSASTAGMTRDCVDPWTYLEVSASGQVRPCCNFPSLGTLAESDADANDLRDSAAFRALRESLLSGNLGPTCQECHIRTSVPTSVLTERLAALGMATGTTEPLAPLRLREIRIDINEKCNLRCDYCAVSAPGYDGVEMSDDVFERVLPLVAQEPEAAVHVNGHGETAFHPKWVAWCTRLLDAGHRPLIITNLAKSYSEEEIRVLARFQVIQVSLDSDDSDLMQRVRKAVRVEHVLETVRRIRRVAEQQRLDVKPRFFASIGVYDRSIWTLESFVGRLIDLKFEAFTFWDLVERSHQNLVRGVHRLDGEQRVQAVAILGKVRRALERAEVPYLFAGDFHGLVPELPRSAHPLKRVTRVVRRVARALGLRRPAAHPV